MRTIKFRAWYGKRTGMLTPEFNGNINQIFSQREGEYMQFTGLHDCNGKEIYEGDIVSRDEDSPDLEVRFEDGCFVIREMVPRQSQWYLHTEADVLEVVDNIYESDQGD